MIFYQRNLVNFYWSQECSNDRCLVDMYVYINYCNTIGIAA